jgi:hypothetical protein
MLLSLWQRVVPRAWRDINGIEERYRMLDFGCWMLVEDALRAAFLTNIQNPHPPLKRKLAI